MNTLVALGLVLIVLPALGSEGEIRVRVIDSKSGQPQPRQAVEVAVYAGGILPDKRTAKFYVETDDSGAATFRFPLPADAVFWLIISDGTGCSNEVFEASQILRVGVVAGNHCWNRSPKLDALKESPGNVILFRQVEPFLERFRHFKRYTVGARREPRREWGCFEGRLGYKKP